MASLEQKLIQDLEASARTLKLHVILDHFLIAALVVAVVLLYRGS